MDKELRKKVIDMLIKYGDEGVFNPGLDADEIIDLCQAHFLKVINKEYEKLGDAYSAKDLDEEITEALGGK